MSNTTPDGSDDSKSILRRRVVKIIFISLLLDLLAFTMPLPLFPRLIASFLESEKMQNDNTLLSSILQSIKACRTVMTSWKLSDSSPRLELSNSKWDVTILGGILGSIFSFCQFLVSPVIGRLSDAYGRKPILLLTMIGNMTSALIWLISTGFGPYLLSRAVGGFSEGNVQLSIAVLSDVSDPSNRAKSLALVGIAFSLCFTFGPMLGAWFAMRSPPLQATKLLGIDLNVYAVPALISFILLLVETIYLAIALPETKHLQDSEDKKSESKSKPGKNLEKSKVESKPTQNHQNFTTAQSVEQRQKRLQILARIHTSFLFFFSGAEFTLTFLTYDLYGFTNAQNGRLLGFIGILSSVLQGGYTRRSKKPPLLFVKSGVIACTISLILLSILPNLDQKYTRSKLMEGEMDHLSWIALYSATAALAYVSASVVNSLNTLASLECDEEDQINPSSPKIARGKTLGDFRSAGQIGRAFGPLFATGLYWTKGPAICYRICAIGTLFVLLMTNQLSKLSQFHLVKNKSS